MTGGARTVASLLLGCLTGCGAADTATAGREDGGSGGAAGADTPLAPDAGVGPETRQAAGGTGGTAGRGAGGVAGAPPDAGMGGMAGAAMVVGGAGGTAVTAPGCKSAARPANAPKLMPGVWTDVSPKPELGGGSIGFGQGVAIDPCNPSTIYVCVDSFDEKKVGGLYKSTDAGTTWNRVGKLDEPVRIRVDPRNPRHLYVGDGVRGGTLGFWDSSDGGDTWAKPAGWTALATTMKLFIDDVYDVAVEPANFDHVLVSSHSGWGGVHGGNSGVLETKDGGTTWILHPPVPGWKAGHSVWFMNGSPTTWLLGTQEAGFWRTTDAGATWAQVTKTNMSHGGGQLYYSKAGGAYYISTSSVILRSPDGVSWTGVKGGPTFTTSVFGDGQTLYSHSAYNLGNQPWYVSPETDGVDWTRLDAQMFGNGPFEMAFDATNRILYSSSWGTGLQALAVK